MDQSLSLHEQLSKTIHYEMGCTITAARICASKVLFMMLNPSDELMLVPGEPYQVKQAVIVPRKEGIELRRQAWNKIITAIQEQADGQTQQSSK